MTVIYRFETANGIGPYRQRDDKFRAILEPELDIFTAHPIPEEDGISRLAVLGWEERSGFASLEQAREWFSKYAIAGLYEGKCLCYEYEVLDPQRVAYGCHQVLFDASAAQKKRALDFGEVFA